MPVQRPATKSVRFARDQAAEIEEYARRRGEKESSLLARATMRGLAELRVDDALLAYVNGASSGEAAVLAGMGRAEFFELAANRQIAMSGERDLGAFHQNLTKAATALGDDRLKRALDEAWAGDER